MVQGVSQLVDEFYQAEDHKCGDQEIDDRCDKITVHQHRCGVTASQLHIQIRKIRASEDCQNRSKDVLIQRSNDSGKCAADDHADCHIHYISPQNKLFKFLNESAFPAHFSLPSSYGILFSPRHSTFDPRHSQSRATALSVTS